jgi:hypothetical protein
VEIREFTNGSFDLLIEFPNEEMIPGIGWLQHVAPPGTPVRDIWIDFIRRYATPVENGTRFRVTPASDGSAIATVYFRAPTERKSLHHAEGEEFDVTSDQSLLVCRRGDPQTATPETSACVSWDEIQYIEFPSFSEQG